MDPVVPGFADGEKRLKGLTNSAFCARLVLAQNAFLLMMDAQKTIGVDFGGTSIKIGVVQGAEVLEYAPPLPTQQYASPAEIIEAMCATIRGLLQHHPEAIAVGLGMPGWTDFYRGVLYQLTNVPVWNHEVPVREIMEQALGLPIVLDNDANCMAYAEWKCGAGRGKENLVCLTLGTGIGGGIIINNRMLRGKTVSAAELGQTSVCFNGRVGPFGNIGAVEEYIGCNEVAADASCRYAEQGIARSPEECTPYLLAQAASSGDAVALSVFDDFAQKLGCLVMNMMYALVPDAFIIGGGVANAGSLLFEPLQKHLKAQLFPVHYAALHILPAHFGSDAGLIGAGLMAADFAKGTLS